MPDLLANLGLTIPSLEARPINQEYENFAQSEADNESFIERALKGLLVDTPAGIFRGLVGIEPDSERRDVSDYANLGTQLLTSGLPFAAYKNILPFGRIFHGTQKLFEKFNPSLYDKGDTLGWMTHFAENPEYAGSYAMGKTKGVLPIEPGLDPLQSSDLNPQKFYNDTTFPNQPLSPHVIPAEIQAKNVLDLVEPNPDDMSQVLASVDPITRKNLIGLFKNTRRDLRETKEAAEKYDDSKLIENAFSDYLSPSHYKESPPINEIPVRMLADKLKLSPEEFNKTPFDAIRYRDISENSWAVPEGTQIKSIFGHEFTEPERNLRVIPSHDPTVGTQNVLNEISQSLNIPISSHGSSNKTEDLLNQLKKALSNIPNSDSNVNKFLFGG